MARAAETNFWNERQKSLQSTKEESNGTPLVASLPVHTMASPTQILRHIPLPFSQTLSSAISKRIQKDIPKNHQGRIGPMLKVLSSQYGTVRKVQIPTGRQSGKTIIHIQDIHLNSEAQGNIGKTIQNLIEQKKIGLIGLEGAFTSIDFSGYRAFKDKEATHIVADYLLRENRISGAVHAALTSHSDIPAVVGVDEPTHYNANVNAYKVSLGKKDFDQKRLHTLNQQINIKESSSLNPSLFSFHSRVKSYRDGKLSLGDYIQVVVKQNPNTSSDLDVFLEAYNMESSLNFSQVESERTALLSQLLMKLSKEETTRLFNTSIACRLGDLNHNDFYQYLKDLCSKKKLALSHFKAMDSYIQYVLLTDSINPDKLLPEIASVESQAYDSLVQTTSERALINESKRLYLISKLIDFSLTPDEWSVYKNLKSSEIDNLDLSSYETFYREAEARNKNITTNLLRAMNEDKVTVAVLVTGGFHSPGIDQLMKEAGVITLSFVPKVTKVDSESGSSYLSVFAQEKTPLDQLFKGEKLFVSPHPADMALTSPLQGAASTHLRYGTPKVSMDGDSGRLDVRFATTHQILSVAFKTSLKEAFLKYLPSFFGRHDPKTILQWALASFGFFAIHYVSIRVVGFGLAEFLATRTPLAFGAIIVIGFLAAFVSGIFFHFGFDASLLFVSRRVWSVHQKLRSLSFLPDLSVFVQVLQGATLMAKKSVSDLMSLEEALEPENLWGGLDAIIQKVGQGQPAKKIIVHQYGPASLARFFFDKDSEAKKSDSIQSGFDANEANGYPVHAESFITQKDETSDAFVERVGGQVGKADVTIIYWHGAPGETPKGADDALPKDDPAKKPPVKSILEKLRASEYKGQVIICVLRPEETLLRYGAEAKEILQQADSVITMGPSSLPIYRDLLPQKPVFAIPHPMAVPDELSESRLQPGAVVGIGTETTFGEMRFVKDLFSLWTALKPKLTPETKALMYAAGNITSTEVSPEWHSDLWFLSNREIVEAWNSQQFRDEESFRNWLYINAKGRMILRATNDGGAVQPEKIDQLGIAEIVRWEKRLLDFNVQLCHEILNRKRNQEKLGSAKEEFPGSHFFNKSPSIPVLLNAGTTKDTIDYYGIPAIVVLMEEGIINFEVGAESLASAIGNPDQRRDMVGKARVAAQKISRQTVGHGYSLLGGALVSQMESAGGNKPAMVFEGLKPFEIVQRVLDQNLNTEEVMQGIDNRLIAGTDLAEHRDALLKLFHEYQAGPTSWEQWSRDFMAFSQRFNSVDQKGQLPVASRNNRKDVIQVMMMARSILARDAAAKIMAAENEAVPVIAGEALKTIETFLNEKISRRDMPEGARKQVGVAKQFVDEWLLGKNLPPYIKQGIIRAMLECRSDDLLFAFGAGWRQFGTAGIRNQAVNSASDGVQLLELEEFARHPSAPTLAGPNTINTVVLLQQSATAKLIIKSLQLYVHSFPEARSVKLEELLRFSNLYDKAKQAGDVPDVVIDLPEEFKTDLLENKVTFAYDSRLNGKHLAHILSADFLRSGIRVDLFNTVAGMPILVYAASRLKSIFGFLISASHSEPNYNGFKFVVGFLQSQVSPSFQKTIMAFRNLVSYDDMSLDLALLAEKEIEGLFETRASQMRWLSSKAEPSTDKKGETADIYGPYYHHLKKRSPIARLLAMLSPQEGPILEATFVDIRSNMKILYTAFSGAGAVNAGNFPGFLKAMGYNAVKLIEKHTLQVNGRFLAFIKKWVLGMPDPGSLEAFVTNFRDYLIQEAGEDLSQIESAVGKFNEYDLSLATDPDIDRSGNVISVPDGAQGNVKQPLLAAMLEYIDDNVVSEKQDALKNKVTQVIQTRMNDKLHLTANDAWMFLVFNNLKMLKEQGQLRKDKLYVIIKSHVTTSGLEDIATAYRKEGYHVYCVDTYVGFTLLAERADQLFNFGKLAWAAANHGTEKSRTDSIQALKILMDPLREAYKPIAGRLKLIDDMMAKAENLFTHEGNLEKSVPEITDILKNLKIIANLDILAGVEESNGYGEFGRLEAKVGEDSVIADEHIREKDGSLAAYEFAELAVYLKSQGKSLYEAYTEMLGGIGSITGTENLYTRYRGAAGVQQKVNNINFFEKLLAFVTGRAQDMGESLTFFGKYKLDTTTVGTVVYRDRKYDDSYLGFPEEGVQFNLIRTYKGNTYKVIVTYRPSGTGMENRDYNWVVGVIPPETSTNLAVIEKIRQDLQEVIREVNQDFFGDPVRGQDGLLLAMQKQGETKFRTLFASAIGKEGDLRLTNLEEQLFEAAMKFASAARQLKGNIKPADREAWAQERATARAASHEAWNSYLKSPEAQGYPNKIEIRNRQGSVILSIPRAMARAWAVSAADYVDAQLMLADISIEDIRIDDADFLSWIRDIHELRNGKGHATPKREDDSTSIDLRDISRQVRTSLSLRGQFRPDAVVDVEVLVFDFDRTAAIDGVTALQGDNLIQIVRALMDGKKVILISGSPYFRQYRTQYSIIDFERESLQRRAAEPIRAELEALGSLDKIQNLTINFISGKGKVNFNAQGEELVEERKDILIPENLQHAMARSLICALFGTAKRYSSEQLIASSFYQRISALDQTNPHYLRELEQELANATGLRDTTFWPFGSEMALIFHDKAAPNGADVIALAGQLLADLEKIELPAQYTASGGGSYAKFALVRKRDVIEQQVQDISPKGIVLALGDSSTDDFLDLRSNEFIYIPVYLGRASDMRQQPEVIVVRRKSMDDDVQSFGFSPVVDLFLTADQQGLKIEEFTPSTIRSDASSFSHSLNETELPNDEDAHLLNTEVGNRGMLSYLVTYSGAKHLYEYATAFWARAFGYQVVSLQVGRTGGNVTIIGRSALIAALGPITSLFFAGLFSYLGIQIGFSNFHPVLNIILVSTIVTIGVIPSLLLGVGNLALINNPQSRGSEILNVLFGERTGKADERTDQLDRLAEDISRVIKGEIATIDWTQIVPVGRITDYSGIPGLRGLTPEEKATLWALVDRKLAGIDLGLEPEGVLEKSFQVGSSLNATGVDVKKLPYLLIAPDAGTDPDGFNQKFEEAKTLLQKGFANVQLEVNVADKSRFSHDWANRLIIRNESLSPDIFSNGDLFVQHGRQAIVNRATSVLVVSDSLFRLMNRQSVMDVGGDIQVVRLSALLMGRPQAVPLSLMMAIYEVIQKHA